MSLPRNIFEILRMVDVDIMDFLDTPDIFPWTFRILLCVLKRANREKYLYRWRRRMIDLSLTVPKMEEDDKG